MSAKNREPHFLFKSISVTVERFNAALLHNKLPKFPDSTDSKISNFGGLQILQFTNLHLLRAKNKKTQHNSYKLFKQYICKISNFLRKLTPNLKNDILNTYNLPGTQERQVLSVGQY